MNYVSQKLFESVVGYKVDFINFKEGGESDYIVDDTNSYISFETFFFMCKKWAYGKGFLVDSRTTTAGSAFILSSPLIFDEEISKTFVDSDEMNAVFTACKWILDNYND
jgi:hypothetical protein